MLQEIAVVLLDVGPLMSPIRDFAGKAICGFLQSKACFLGHLVTAVAGHLRTHSYRFARALLQMLNKPTHEVEVVYYGTTGVCRAVLGFEELVPVCNASVIKLVERPFDTLSPKAVLQQRTIR